MCSAANQEQRTSADLYERYAQSGMIFFGRPAAAGTIPHFLIPNCVELASAPIFIIYSYPAYHFTSIYWHLKRC